MEQDGSRKLVYTQEQLSQYLAYIDFPREMHPQDPFQLLSELCQRQRAKVPFESIDLHYTRARLLSLDLQDLFHKVVVRKRGGYCMELNTLFVAVLRTLGFTLYTTGARVKLPRATDFEGCHMLILVSINDIKYMCDVAFGSNGPSLPMELRNGLEERGMLPYATRLEYRSIPQHHDQTQRLWVYHYENESASPTTWIEGYAFSELEFFPTDYEVMNSTTMTSPRSFFVQTVFVQRTIWDNVKHETVGLVILNHDHVKKRHGEEKFQVLETFRSEQDRVRALEQYFGILLTEEERKAIRGLATELKG